MGADGISIFDGNDYSDREYVRQAMEGNIYVSEPLISKITGELSIMVAAPLYAEGNYGESIVGVSGSDNCGIHPTSITTFLYTSSSCCARPAASTAV